MTWSDLGAIYEAAAPKLNAAKAPGAVAEFGRRVSSAAL